MEGPVLRDRKVHLTEKLSYGKNRFEHHARDDVSNFYISIVSLFYNLIDFDQKRMFRAVSFLPFNRTNEKIPLSTLQNANLEDCCTIRYRFRNHLDLRINIITRDGHTPRDFLSTGSYPFLRIQVGMAQFRPEINSTPITLHVISIANARKTSRSTRAAP